MTRFAAAGWTILVLLLVGSGVLTVLRLSDPASEIGVQLQAYTPFAALGYVFALVVLLLLASRRRTRHWALLVPAVLGGAGLVLHLIWVSPSFVGAGRVPDARAETVTVIGANMYFGRGDGAALVREAQSRGVDVLVASEITADTLSEMEGAGLTELLPHRAGRPGAENEGTMVFSRQPVRVLRRIGGTTFDNLLVRTDAVSLLAAHPAAPLDPAAWREDHARLLDVVTEARPDVVVGDLNATLDHVPVREIEAADYRDSAELLNAGLQPTWPANGLYPLLGLFPPTVPIDHVLLAPGWTATRTGTLEVPDTDHLALVVTVTSAA